MDCRRNSNNWLIFHHNVWGIYENNYFGWSLATSSTTSLITVLIVYRAKYNLNKGNAKRGISPHLKIWPGDIDLWSWKSIGFQTLLRAKYVPSLVKIHWRMLILECSQGCYTVNNLTRWPWKSIGFQMLLKGY